MSPTPNKQACTSSNNTLIPRTIVLSHQRKPTGHQRSQCLQPSCLVQGTVLCDREPQGFWVGGKGTGVHSGVTSCAIFSSSLGTKLLWFLSPERSAELRRVCFACLEVIKSLLTTTLAFSPASSDPQAYVLLSQAEGCASVQYSNLGNGSGKQKTIHHISTQVFCEHTTTSEAQHFCSVRQRASQDGMTFPHRPPQVPQDTDPGSWGEPRKKIHPAPWWQEDAFRHCTYSG